MLSHCVQVPLAGQHPVPCEVKVVLVPFRGEIPLLPQRLGPLAQHLVRHGRLGPTWLVVACHARLSTSQARRPQLLCPDVEHPPVDGLLQLIPAPSFSEVVVGASVGARAFKGKAARATVHGRPELQHQVQVACP